MNINKAEQIQLMLQYRKLAKEGTMLSFRDVEFRNFSQTGEDGILHYIFSLIGAKHRVCVEICAGNGKESNSANLILNHGWKALLVDGNKKNVQFAKEFFKNHPDGRIRGPICRHYWVTRGNVDSLLVQNGFRGEIDLLSIDIDGVDYWLWERISAVSPRIVVIECLPFFQDRSITVPYADDFVAKWIKIDSYDSQSGESSLDYFHNFTVYSGATLRALVKLGKKKGYKLIGVNHLGFNAFFIKTDDQMADTFAELDVSECFMDGGQAFERAEEILRSYQWVEI